MGKLIDIALRLLSNLLPFVRTGGRRIRVSAAIIVVSNAIPLAGAVFLGWSPFHLLLLYWTESAIIGVFNIAAMFSCGLLSEKGAYRILGLFGALILSAFFTVHYGGFMAGHLLFLFVLFAPGFSGFDFGFVAETFSGALSDGGLVSAFILLFLSHAWGFWAYFLKEKRYLTSGPQQLMIRPYVRIFIMQITIIIGAAIAMSTGWSPALIALWVALKTGADLFILRREVKKSAKPETAAQKRRPAKDGGWRIHRIDSYRDE